MAEPTKEQLEQIYRDSWSGEDGAMTYKELSIVAIKKGILIERERCFQACINFANSNSYDENYRSVIYDCADHIRSGN